MEERWRFLSPWTKTLRTRIKYRWPETTEGIWTFKRRMLEVYPPARFEKEDFERELNQEEEEEFHKTFQHFREALALLVAVAHVDESGWRYILEHQCGVQFGVEGEKSFEEQVPVMFQLFMEKGKTKFSYPENLEADFIRWFGVNQRENCSEEYVETLKKIAALDKTLQPRKPAVDIKVPVRMIYESVSDSSNQIKALQGIANADKEVRKEWEVYQQHTVEGKDVELGWLRCTFVLEPLLFDYGEGSMPAQVADMLVELVRDNTSFSQVSVWCGRLGNVHQEDVCASKLAFGKVMTALFNTARQPRKATPMNLNFYSGATTGRKSRSFQIGAVHVTYDCNHEAHAFEAMYSAIVSNKTTRTISMFNNLNPELIEGSTGAKWKGLAYALFSKRARECSSLESLALTSFDAMTAEEMEGFTAVVNSEHPEETLFGTARGVVHERDAVIPAGSSIHWQFTDQGQPRLDVPQLILDSSISLARTFSDDGESDLVNVVVPGYGRCQVKRSALVFSEEKFVKPKYGGVTSLALGFGSDDEIVPAGLPSFLLSIGGSLKKLTLSETTLDLDVNMFLRYCPHLEELALWICLMELQFDFCEYHDNNEPLPELNYDWEDVIAVMEGLSNNTSSLARCCRRLRVRLGSERDDWLDFGDDVKALLTMLELNQSLEYLEVMAPSNHRTTVANFRHFHLKPIMRGRGLKMKDKLAFMSTLTHRFHQLGPVTKGDVRGTPRCFKLVLWMSWYFLRFSSSLLLTYYVKCISTSLPILQATLTVLLTIPQCLSKLLRLVASILVHSGFFTAPNDTKAFESWEKPPNHGKSEV